STRCPVPTDDLQDTLDQLHGVVGGLRTTVRRLRIWVAVVVTALVIAISTSVGLIATIRHGDTARHDLRCAAIEDMDERLRGRTIDALTAWSTHIAVTFLDDPDLTAIAVETITAANDEADRVLSRPVVTPGCDQ